MRVQVVQRGNSLGVRLPEGPALRLGIAEGSRAEMRAEQDRIVISVAHPVPTLEEPLVGMTPEELHEAFAWGEDRGREIVADRATAGQTAASGPAA